MSTILTASPVRWIAPAVLTWTALTGGAAYAGQLPADTASAPVTSDPVQTRMSSDAHAASVQAAIADVHGFATGR
jgi:hypothetical protein